MMIYSTLLDHLVCALNLSGYLQEDIDGQHFFGTQHIHTPEIVCAVRSSDIHLDLDPQVSLGALVLHQCDSDRTCSVRL